MTSDLGRAGVMIDLGRFGDAIRELDPGIEHADDDALDRDRLVAEDIADARQGIPQDWLVVLHIFPSFTCIIAPAAERRPSS